MWIQKVPGGGVLALAYSPDGKTLYTKDGGGWVSAWDTATQTGRRLFRTDHRYYGGLLLAGRGRYLVAVGGPVFVLDTTTGNVRSLQGDTLTFERVATDAIHPDPLTPRLLALDEGRRTIYTWGLDDWGAVSRLAGWKYRNDPESFQLTPDGRACMRADIRGNLVLFDVTAGSEIARFRPRIRRVYYRYHGHPAPDGRTVLVSSGHDLFIWDLEAGRLRAGPIATYLGGTIMAFHPTAPVFAAASPFPEVQLTLFSLETGEVVRVLDFGLGARVQCVAFAPDGLTCAVGGSNKQFAVFDVDV
jgi:WD40 repeat protein